MSLPDLQCMKMAGTSSANDFTCLSGIRHASRHCALLVLVLCFTDLARAESWEPLNIINVGNLDWDEAPRFGAKSKTLLHTDEKGSLIYAEFSPSWNMDSHGDRLGAHFHYWREWAYILKGDFVIHEPVAPFQENPPAYRFIEGTWLDRPAHSLHGGNWETGGIRSQNPVIMLLFEEGDGSVVTVGTERGEGGKHFKPDFPDSQPDPHMPDWPKFVTDFPRAWIVDSAQTMEWERDPLMPGRFVKWLSNNVSGGFRAQLVKAPPGWKPPSETPPTYYSKGHVLRYMLHGNMKIWQYTDKESRMMVHVGPDTLVHQPPGSIWGYGGGPVTLDGAMWLEVTYAGDLVQGAGPIKDPVAIE